LTPRSGGNEIYNTSHLSKTTSYIGSNQSDHYLQVDVV